MIKKFAVAAGLCAGVALGASQASAQTFQTLHSTIFPFSGTCAGVPNVIGGTLGIPSAQLAPSGLVTIDGSDIVVYQIPGAASNIQYAVVGTANGTDVYGWLGPGATRQLTNLGSAGSYNVSGAAVTSAGNGFAASNEIGINFTFACSGSASWAAYVTIYWHSP